VSLTLCLRPIPSGRTNPKMKPIRRLTRSNMTSGNEYSHLVRSRPWSGGAKARATGKPCGARFSGGDPRRVVTSFRNVVGRCLRCGARLATCGGLFTRRQAACQAAAGFHPAPHPQNRKVPIVRRLANGFLQSVTGELHLAGLVRNIRRRNAISPRNTRGR
jgi:hypothetical protein